jgi:hypothetical protein
MSAAAAGRRYDFGGVAVAFDSPSASWLAALDARFAGFETAAAPRFAIRYLPVGEDDGSRDALRGPLPPDVRHDAEGRVVEMLGPGFAASIDLGARAAQVRGPASVYPVDMVLRELLPTLAGGIVLHCALLSDGAAAWACCGASGTGKSTLAALLPERALCDELAVVSRDGAAFRARSLPYWEARPGGAPLAGVAILSHGAAHVRRRLSPEEALRALSPEVVWPGFPDTAVEAAFDTFAALLAAVPAWSLEFAPRADVWDALTAEA